MKSYDAFGALIDELADFVAVAGFFLEEREDQQFRAAFLEFAIKCFLHIWL